MTRVQYEATIDDSGKKLGDVIANKMKVSKRLVKRCKAHEEGILVNGQRRTVRYIIEAGDVISLAMTPSSHPSDIIHEEKPLHIVYEDDMLMVVDKPPGVTMFPRRKGELGSLAGAVLAHLEKNGEACHYHPVSRLDIGTSGLVLLAKNSYVAGQLSKNKAVKCYQCFAYGKIMQPIYLNQKICEVDDTYRKITGALFSVGNNGKVCGTGVQPIYYDEHLKASALWIRLDTGRRHQIRVHLAHQGHPIIGDTAYGGPSIVANRPLLHAASLSYQHPIDGRIMHHFLGMHVYNQEPTAITNLKLQEDIL